ncbi:hypothetical protein SAZ11_00485 [Streptomyces sp. FXJ1.4098]|nr:hypothetical protein [Streptomyces sp. FXJ1.4098]
MGDLVLRHTPLDDKELSGLRAAVLDWDNSWNSDIGDVFPHLLAHAFDVRIDIASSHSRADGRPGLRGMRRGIGPASAAWEIELFHSRVVDASGRPMEGTTTRAALRPPVRLHHGPRRPCHHRTRHRPRHHHRRSGHGARPHLQRAPRGRRDRTRRPRTPTGAQARTGQGEPVPARNPPDRAVAGSGDGPEAGGSGPTAPSAAPPRPPHGLAHAR